MPPAVVRALAYPLFILLHASFTLVSLVLRLLESIQPRSISRRHKATQPQHVAVTFISYRKQQEPAERRALIESLKRIVQWAGEDGVKEISVYSDSGWDGVSEALRLPPSGTSRSSLTESSGQSITPPDSMASESNSEDEDTAIESEGEISLPSTPSKSSNRASGSQLRARGSSRLHSAQIPSSTITLTFPTSPRHKSHQEAGVTLRLLHSMDLGSVALDLAKSGTPPSQITIQSIDVELRHRFELSSDPDLLIVHPLSPLGGFRSLLPRPAPELGGYPFWFLRITEIYHHPPPFPLTSTIAPLVVRLRSSTLPALKKLGFRMPLVQRDEVRGAMTRDAWTAGLAALVSVEQRLGK